MLRHALGVSDLSGLRALDVGCSAGFIADELALAGAETVGVDIDEPGLAAARHRFGERVNFELARGEAMPFPDNAFDIVVFNHIYEHVVDPEAVVAQIRRVLSPQGALYLGIGHKHQIIEPHYTLPLLSWLPQPAADRYLRLTGKGEHYYERYYTRGGLKRLFGAFDVWDYTLPVLADARAFAGDDLIPAWAARIPERALAAALPLVPTYIWVAFGSARIPTGPPLRIGPRRI